MSPTQINIAIAESLGSKVVANWEHVLHPNGVNISTPLFIDGSRMGQTVSLLPRYTTDLNACAEFEATLTSDTASKFAKHLAKIVLGYSASLNITVNFWTLFRVASATAPQRCEAYLRTIGKWEVQT